MQKGGKCLCKMALALTRYGLSYGKFMPASAPGMILLHSVIWHNGVPTRKSIPLLSPTSAYYEGASHPVDLTIGKDAAWYHGTAAHVNWG